jgi:hypothetical protein
MWFEFLALVVKAQGTRFKAQGSRFTAQVQSSTIKPDYKPDINFFKIVPCDHVVKLIKKAKKSPGCKMGRKAFFNMTT